MARCVYSLCQSDNTKMIERTCRLVYDKGKIVNCYISELWLCNNCGNPFKPSVMKVMPWHLRLKTYGKKEVPPTKTEITRELFQ